MCLAGFRLWLAALLVALGASSARGVESFKADSRHWAFQPLQRAPLPAVGAADPVDALVRIRLGAAGLAPSPTADRLTLLRRVWFGLVGLPPTPEAVEEFLGDSRPDAYARMVERLLASPRYGERWAQHWLDAAGYADSNGYFNADTDRPLAYRYRDYVIRSLNRDLPFDRFVQEQLAGDELSAWRPGQPATPEVIELLEATHFLRNGQDGSGESDGNPDEVRVDRYYALEGAVQIIGSTLLGLTVQCAKCHDHKFEPFTQRDYYALQAVLYPAFNIDRWVKPNDRVVDAHMPGVLEAWTARERQLDAEAETIRGGFAAWSRTNRLAGRVRFEDRFEDGRPLADRWTATAPDDDAPAGQPPVRLDSSSAPGAYVREGRLHLLESGAAGDRWLSTREAFDWRPAAEGGWIEATFELKALNVADGGRPAERVGFVLAAHDFNDNSAVPGGNVLIDGHPDGVTTVHVDYPGNDSRSIGDLGRTRYQPGHRLGVRITAVAGGRYEIQQLTDGLPEGKAVALEAADLPRGAFAFEYCCGRSFVVDDLRIEASDDSNPQWVQLAADYRGRLEARQKERDRQLDELASQRTPRPPRIAWMSDAGPESPVVPLLKRGNPKTPGEAISPDIPSFLKTPGSSVQWPQPAEGARTTGRRLAWARWLTEPGSRQAALLARVTVNRLWQAHFGQGLVATPDNLGQSGTPPVQRELLDALAAEFIESGWSLKAMHRRILLSATYRQSSASCSEAVAADPANTLLWRYPVHRLDAEAIRDAMMASAGVLAGKSSGPYVPTPRRGDGEVVEDAKHPEALARSVFLQHRRTQVPTFLGNFDAPAVVFNCTRRATTTMPLQALSLLNSEFSRSRAADLARRLDREAGKGTEPRLRRAFLLTCGRPPEAVEVAAATEFLARQAEVYRAAPDAGTRAWTDLCQTLFGLNRFLYVE